MPLAAKGGAEPGYRPLARWSDDEVPRARRRLRPAAAFLLTDRLTDFRRHARPELFRHNRRLLVMSPAPDEPADMVLRSAFDWLRACTNTPRGNVFVQNLLTDILNTSLPPSVWLDFLRRIHRPPISTAASDIPLSEHVDLADSVLAKGFDLKGPSLNAACPSYWRISNAADIISPHYFNFSSLGGLQDDPGGGRLHTITDAYERLMQLRRSSVDRYGATLKSSSYLKGYRRHIVWLADGDDLARPLAACPPDEQASLVRDLLGLAHHADNQLLIAQVVPSACLTTDALHKPTVFDAGTCIVYKSTPDPRAPGRTVDLRSLAEGVSEYVTAPILFSSNIKLVMLGRITHRGSIRWADLCSPVHDEDISRVQELARRPFHD